MDVLEIPGYVDAVLQERLVRDAAFLDVTETVGPPGAAFELAPMTLRHWLILRVTRNPLLDRGEDRKLPTPEELAHFLWVLRTDKISRPTHDRRCQRAFFPPPYLPLWNTARARVRHQRAARRKLELAAQLIDSARAYAAEAMQDEPQGKKSHGYLEDYYSDGAWFCVLFGMKFGWSQDEVLDTSLKRLFQYTNALRRMSGDSMPMANPSDAMKARWMRTQNQNPRSQ